MPPDPDQDLVDRWRRAHRESEQVSREIFDRHWRSVAGAFHRKGHPRERVQELTQETFLRVFKKLETFRGDSFLAGWILRIAASLHVDEIRQASSQMRTAKVISLDGQPDPAPEPADSAASPEMRALYREKAGAVLRALTGLSDKQRLCLVLRDVHDLGEEEIAWLLQMKRDTVRVHISHARKELRKALP